MGWRVLAFIQNCSVISNLQSYAYCQQQKCSAHVGFVVDIMVAPLIQYFMNWHCARLYDIMICLSLMWLTAYRDLYQLRPLRSYWVWNYQTGSKLSTLACRMDFWVDWFLRLILPWLYVRSAQLSVGCCCSISDCLVRERVYSLSSQVLYWFMSSGDKIEANITVLCSPGYRW